MTTSSPRATARRFRRRCRFRPPPYKLLDWLVPSATGGSLRIDSAPTQAVIGETGTVRISWSGLNAGTRYVGAVSHNDGDGSIGHTIVQRAELNRSH